MLNIQRRKTFAEKVFDNIYLNILLKGQRESTFLHIPSHMLGKITPKSSSLQLIPTTFNSRTNVTPKNILSILCVQYADTQFCLKHDLCVLCTYQHKEAGSSFKLSL